MPQDRIDLTEPHDNGRDGTLSARERDVAELIAEGLSNDQIAERLVLTSGTVANHVAHILAKLGLNSRVQIAVKVARQNGSGDVDTILGLLETLRQVDSATAREAMQHATNVLAAAFAADKVDAFFYDDAAGMLTAIGTSDTPMGRRQHHLGLDSVPLSNGGRAAWVFHEDTPYISGHVDQDPIELVAVWQDLGVRSAIGAPIHVGGGQLGVVIVVSGQPEQFTADQLHLLEFVAYWIGLVARERSGPDGELTNGLTHDD